jgi:hypothetical protein
MEPADPASVDDAMERRLRRIVRLVFYPVVIALIAFVWQHRQASVDAKPFNGVAWADAGGHVAALTVDGRLVSFDADLTYYCPGHPSIRWRWPAERVVAHLTQHGTSATGTEGPGTFAWDGGWNGVTVTTIRATIGAEISGKLWGQIDLAAEGYPSSRRVCRSSVVAFTLHPR